MEDDVEIIQRVKNGTTNDFGLLVEKYHRHLLNFIYRITFDELIVEDIGQDVFVAAYSSLGNFDETRGTPFSAWLFTIARNRCLSDIRKKKTEKAVTSLDPDLLADDSGNPEKEMIMTDQKNALEKSLDLLPEPFKTAMLDSLLGESIENSASKRRVSPNTMKTRLFRAREKLKQLLVGTERGQGL